MNSTLDDKMQDHKNAIDRVSRRRVIWLDEVNYIFTVNEMRRIKILMWIDRHTSGLFYLGGSTVGFHDEHDALIFRLGYKDD